MVTVMNIQMAMDIAMEMACQPTYHRRAMDIKMEIALPIHPIYCRR
jgi:hypothetical protein